MAAVVERGSLIWRLATMKLKRITRIACLSIASFLGALFLLVAIYYAANSGSGHTEFSFTPRKWRFTICEEWTLMDTNSTQFGTLIKTHVGPFVIEHYE